MPVESVIDSISRRCCLVELSKKTPQLVATCWVYRGGLPGILTCGVGWGGVGCVNVGVHVYTWYAAAGVLMCTHGTWGGVGWGGVGWGVSTLVFMCTHGTLLVC